MEPAMVELAQEIFRGVTLAKMALAVSMVVALSVIAEHVSPRIAGILSGYPLGAAITLFFLALEIGADFAAESAQYTMVGLIATQTFAFVYFRCSLRVANGSKITGIILSAVAGISAYFLTIALCQRLHTDLATAFFLSAFSIVGFSYLLNDVSDVKIEGKVPLNLKALAGRGLFAAVVIVLITASARAVGPAWAGLFSAFPLTMMPLLVIMHFSHRLEHVHTTIKNGPKGIGSVLVYALAVNLWYPHLGVYLGTLVAYIIATIYLVLVARFWRTPQR
jgi:uncharacterized membrane protein (GlpM family)